MSTEKYNIRESEAKWRKIWEEQACFTTTEDPEKPKYYVLEMFPYPSGRIHVGHVRNYALGDVVARYRAARGYNVIHPMGWDAFGLPAENAAIERGEHPAKWTYANIKSMRGQLKSMGLSIDWSREIATCHPQYYKHEQKMFLDFLKKGIAYRKESLVNWDPVENTVLANEQVVDGRGWRSGAPVERRRLNQWFLKITDYADELRDDLQKLDRWPEKVRIMQENWIGKSRGLQFKWDITGTNEKIEVFTTRPDTLFGASFLALAPDHPLAQSLCKARPGFDKFVQTCQSVGTSEEAIAQAEKLGFDTGHTATHPLLGREVPIYVANFILMDYGTGAVFGVPAHDQRDFDFAKKYNLPVLPVIAPDSPDAPPELTQAYTGEGMLVNSQCLNGLTIEAAKEAVIAKCEADQSGFGATQFRLRDWGISRQRYWGCPIPIIYCETCGPVPVPESQLPVTLPEDVTFDKTGNPLANHPTWKNTDCPVCSKPAQRETDTFDTFFESSWYQFRYCDPRNDSLPVAKDKAAYWMPVEQYIGGVEHAVLHLLYARFFTKALRDCGYVDCSEPFAGLFTQGMVTHETYQNAEGKWLFPSEILKGEDGKFTYDGGKPVKIGPSIKMSKSKKNVVDPEDILATYGADAARLFILSDSPPERDLEWTESGIEGAWRYVNRLHRMIMDYRQHIPANDGAKPAHFDAEILKLRQSAHKAIENVSADIEAFAMNKAVARIRELSNKIAKPEQAADYALLDGGDWALKETLEILIKLMNPMMPHLAEELWSALGHNSLLAKEPWPVADPALLVEESITIGVQVNGKVRASLSLPPDAAEDEARSRALAQENVIKAMNGLTLRKFIYVPGKIINIVAG
ncbi:MAG: leucine--tRNA ligase [Alphaproteobacteria bacterium]|nr:leucine--tRNA ligase [Alphaproteobacteria bacterium]